MQDFEDFIERIFIIVRCPSFRNLAQILKSRYVKIKMFKDVPIYFQICFEVSWYNKNHKYGALKKSEIMEMLGFGSSDNKTVILLDQDEAD